MDGLTRGASTVYRAGAPAGVVDFIMNDHYQGFCIDANTAMYNHSQHKLLRAVRSGGMLWLGPSTVNDGKARDITLAVRRVR